MSRKEMERDLSFIKSMMDDVFSIIVKGFDVIHTRLHCHNARIKTLESRIDAIEKEVYDEY